MATLHSSHSLTWPLDASSERCHALGRRVVSSLKIIHFSSFGMAPGEPSRRRASTWQRQVQSKAALRANGFACNTNQRGFRTGSIGREEPAGLASLDSDGPASQSRRQGHPTNASVQNQEPHEAPDGNQQSSASYAARVRRARTAEKLMTARMDFSKRNRLASAKVESISKISRNEEKETAKETFLKWRSRKKREKSTLRVALVRRSQLALFWRSVSSKACRWMGPATMVRFCGN